jgi:hypothetical protein
MEYAVSNDGQILQCTEMQDCKVGKRIYSHAACKKECRFESGRGLRVWSARLTVQDTWFSALGCGFESRADYEGSLVQWLTFRIVDPATRVRIPYEPRPGDVAQR